MESRDLPIWGVMPRAVAALKERRNIVIVSPTGSGKTTQVPQAILNAGLLGDNVMLVVQPRRVACRMAARRVALERSVPLGNEVGYAVRYEGQTSRDTRLCFVTDGVLMRFLERDPTLAHVGVVVFDEFHERRLLSDVALGMLKAAQRHNADLRIVAMSATMKAEKLAGYLDADIIEAEGIIYPVTARYQPHHFDYSRLSQQIAKAIVECLAEDNRSGDVLVFLPGKGEIQAVGRYLRTRLNRRSKLADATILPLHGELPGPQQDKVFQPTESRKIILATNVAETSLTIPGIRTVIDVGLERRMMYDAATGANSLQLTAISQASAAQRAGRAGREAPGCCYRLWSEPDHLGREEITPPEILRVDVSSMVLTLKAVGVKNIRQFDFFEPPSEAQITSAEKLLMTLGALNERGELTQIGRLMLRLPLPPRYARMVVEAERSRCMRELAVMAALLAGRPVLQRPPGKERVASDCHRTQAVDDSSDLFTLFAIYHSAQQRGFSLEWCVENYLNFEALVEARKLRGSIASVALSRGARWNKQPANRAVVRRCIASGLVDRLGKKIGTRSYEMASGVIAKLDDSSSVAGQFLVAAEVRTVTTRLGATQNIASLVTRVDIPMLEQLAPQHFSDVERTVEELPITGLTRVRRERRYLNLTLESNEMLVQKGKQPLKERLASLSATVARLTGKK